MDTDTQNDLLLFSLDIINKEIIRYCGYLKKRFLWMDEKGSIKFRPNLNDFKAEVISLLKSDPGFLLNIFDKVSEKIDWNKVVDKIIQESEAKEKKAIQELDNKIAEELKYEVY